MARIQMEKEAVEEARAKALGALTEGVIWADIPDEEKTKRAVTAFNEYANVCQKNGYSQEEIKSELKGLRSAALASTLDTLTAQLKDKPQEYAWAFNFLMAGSAVTQKALDTVLGEEKAKDKKPPKRVVLPITR